MNEIGEIVARMPPQDREWFSADLMSHGMAAAMFYGDAALDQPWPGLAWSRFHYNPDSPVVRFQ